MYKIIFLTACFYSVTATADNGENVCNQVNVDKTLRKLAFRYTQENASDNPYMYVVVPTTIENPKLTSAAFLKIPGRLTHVPGSKKPHFYKTPEFANKLIIVMSQTNIKGLESARVEPQKHSKQPGLSNHTRSPFYHGPLPDETPTLVGIFQSKEICEYSLR